MIGKAGLAAVLVVAASTGMAQISDPVRLDAGSISAAPANAAGVRAFRGLPFAAPPLGDLRWRAPRPVEPWQSVRDASEFADVCIQPPGQGRLNIAVLPDGPGMSEDCLYLNVWTPADSAADALPVLVYIYGGAFTEGAGSVPLYDGAALAEKGAVVVTMNYRLGAFGFLAHPELTRTSEHGSSGNYGLADMLASLQWVQSNIGAFGGDPRNVTVFGQSAGAMAIASLLASPRAEGLFNRAISQSGAWMGLGMSAGMRTREQAEEAGAEAAAEAGVATADEMRAMSADDVVASFRSAGMIVDGWIIPEDPSDVFAAGRQNAADVLVGSNKDESFFPGGPDAQQFETQARQRFGDLAEEYLSLYPHATNAEAAISSSEAFRDQTFWHMRLYADYQAKMGKHAYLFFFTQNPPGPAGEADLPATHASEVPYVFNNLGQLPLFPDGSDPELAAASSDDLAVADRMSSYWVNFARNGDPNGPGLPTWLPYRSGGAVEAAILDAHPSLERLPSVERLSVYDRLYEHMRAQ
jgi:para-nitrobenzyl esterase